MIKVTIELIPAWGDESNSQHLGTAWIVNDGVGGLDLGNYDFALSKWGEPEATWRKGRIEGFPRQRLGPWDLLFRILRVAVGSRNKEKSLE